MKNEKLKRRFKKILKDWMILRLRLTNETSRLLERTEKLFLEFLGKEHPYLEEFKRIKHDFMFVDIHPFDSGNDDEIAKWHESKENMMVLLEKLNDYLKIQ